jgi:hypothetical protein
MSMLTMQHYRIRFRESQRLRYRLPHLVWRTIIANRATHLELDRAKNLLATLPVALNRSRAERRRSRP